MRAIHELDPTLPLSQALVDVLTRPNAAGESFNLGKTLLVVPAGRLARAVERRLLDRARGASSVLEAPSIVTPLMLFGRFIAPTKPLLSRIGAEASWRESIEQIAATDPALCAKVAAAFGSPPELPNRLRPRVAKRLAKLSAEVASAMHTFASVRVAMESLAAVAFGDQKASNRVASDGEFGEAQLVEHWRALEACAGVRNELLAAAGVCDRDDALRDALLAEAATTMSAPMFPSAEAKPAARLAASNGLNNVGFDRVVILFADPEPVHRALFRALEARGVAIEVCVHAVRAWAPDRSVESVVASSNSLRDDELDDELDDEGFPQRARWASHVFGTDVIAHDAIRVGEGPRDAAEEAVEAIRAIPAPRRSDEIAVMAADDDTRRAIETALGEAGSNAARVESRVFSATRLGTLLARLEALLGDESLEAFSAYIRHPDVSRALASEGDEYSVARYRVETLAESWRDKVSGARGAAGFRAIRDKVEAQVAPLFTARPIAAWASVIRSYLQTVVGENASGAFANERARSIAALDRVFGELADVPAAFATAIDCAEVVRLIRAAVDRTEIRGEGREFGVSIVRWLDAGVADEPHLVLAGFSDGAVPEGEVADALIPDAIRRKLGLLSSERRAARDAWILDGILRRAIARRAIGLPASVQFVAARRSASGDPLRPSRFLLRVERAALPARVARLFPAERERKPAVEVLQRSVEFPVRPKVEGSVFESISVTAFATYLKCPYLFQLQRDPRLRLESLDESAVELDARGFGNLLHKAVESWGEEEATQSRPTTDRATIERSVLAHLDTAVAQLLPAQPAAAVRVQLEILRARLRRFAVLQAKEAEQGWHVRFVELSFDETTGPLLAAAGASTSGPARALRLVGRIDRVDQHIETGAWRALDYKTGSVGSAPAATHLKGRKIGSRTWKDLQLPLYCYLLAEGKVETSQPIQVQSNGLGYINLAASAERSGFRMLECASSEFDAAFDEARRVVDGVLRGEFAPAKRTPFPPDDPLAAVWGLGLRAQALKAQGLESLAGVGDSEAGGGETSNASSGGGEA